MTRKKVNLSLIVEKKKRDEVYRKRVQTMKKNLTEITKRCGIKACLIAYPKESDSLARPDIWPSGADEVHELINRFKGMAIPEQQRNMENHESQLQKNIENAVKDLVKIESQKKRIETTFSMLKCLQTRALPSGLSVEDANGLGNVLDNTLKEINERMEKLKRSGNESHKNQDIVSDVGASGSKGKEPMVGDDDGLTALQNSLENQKI